MASFEPNTSLPHIAAVPRSGSGHINPMLNLCRLLAAAGDHPILISFIATQEDLDPVLGSAPFPANLRPVALPNLPYEHGPRDIERHEELMQMMEAAVDAAVAALSPAVDFVVADASLPWVGGFCGRQKLPVAGLWTQSAAGLKAVMRWRELDAEGRPAPVDVLQAQGKEDKALAYMPRFMTDHLPHYNAPESALARGYVKMIFSWLPTSHCLLLSAPIELETSAVDSLSSDLSFPVYSIGPFIPYMNLNRTETGKQEPYVKWLDSQPNSSVLYISLGSSLSASTEQVNEMLMGLNASGIHYLRVSLDKHNQLKDLDGERGMVVPWCDQLRVLSHPSVGGFLTHCGWNSTMEGIYTGVPMLTFPLFTDQYPNSKLIVDDWRIGLRLKDEETQRIIRREEVERIVGRFMDLESEESKGMRTRVAELKEKCRRAVGDGGSSTTSLEAFVQAMLTIKKV